MLKLCLSYNSIIMSISARISTALLFLALGVSPSWAFPDHSGIATVQADLRPLPLGQRIALWAEAFVGTPYDPDPMGVYVRSRAIVADKRVDCMYLTFRAVELALSTSPEEALQRALEMRFVKTGRLSPDGSVENYEDRYKYAMDMITGGKWGRNITVEVLPETETVEVPGERDYGPVRIIPAANIPQALPALRSGDVIFFVKDPDKRVVGEIIGHMGLLKREGKEIFLIHASGHKVPLRASGHKLPSGEKQNGQVFKLPLAQYARTMPFAGIIITRF